MIDMLEEKERDRFDYRILGHTKTIHQFSKHFHLLIKLLVEKDTVMWVIKKNKKNYHVGERLTTIIFK